MRSVKEIFSNNLRNKLYEKNATQAQLAKFVGVSQTSVSHWINGEILPRPKMIDKIALYLNCTSDYLMTDHSSQAELTPEDVLTEVIKESPRLFRLMFYASKLPDDRLDDLIERARK